MELKELRVLRGWLGECEWLGEFWWLDVLEWLGEWLPEANPHQEATSLSAALER